jgi:hypothetical protein
MAWGFPLTGLAEACDMGDIVVMIKVNLQIAKFFCVSTVWFAVCL